MNFLNFYFLIFIFEVFVGALPRHTKAGMLAEILRGRFGPICYVGIDTDPAFDYPQGAARITFRLFHSYVKAIANRYITIPNDGCTKRVSSFILYLSYF